MTSFTAAFFRSLARRRSVAQLRELDAHLLDDIGLSPTEFRRATRRDPLFNLFGTPNR